MSELSQFSKLELLNPSDTNLNLVSEIVEPNMISSPSIQAIIDRMFEIALGEQGDASHKTLVGLAAPQIGILKRIIIVGTNSVGAGEQPQLEVFINPEITYESEAQEENREGCYSTGEICGIVSRAKIVTVSAYNRLGKVQLRGFEGFPARVMQHEIDHLDGIRFPARITDESKLHSVPEDQFGAYREGWKNWINLASFATWEAMHSGKDVE